MPVWPNGSKTIPRVTSEYGPRAPIDTNGDGRPDTSSFHTGIDLVGFPNNKAPFAGVVIFAAYNGGAGNEIRIRAANGDVARIKHNRLFLVSVGQQVAEGQDVGVMGTTGASTGVHCHFETWPGGASHTNPRDYMARAIPAGGGSSAGILQGDDMPRLIRHPNGTITTVGETTYQHHSIPTYLADTAAFGPYAQLTAEQFQLVISNTQVRLAYLKAQLAGSPGSAVDPAAIATKVEQNLTDDFARLADQIAELSQLVDNGGGPGVGVDGIREVVRDELSKLQLTQA